MAVQNNLQGKGIELNDAFCRKCSQDAGYKDLLLCTPAKLQPAFMKTWYKFR
jgi:hypothetical protein